MRLLERNDAGEIKLTRYFIGDDIPQYAILSHTWGADTEEVSFKDMIDGTAESRFGYDKIRFCAEQAKRDGLQYFWVDTCCIDKTNNTELSEAINSMFRWYRQSTKCYVYLLDVLLNPSSVPWLKAFRSSRWFTRGWTLQELIAPTSVEFFSKDGKELGDKKILEREIHKITGVPIEALQGSPLSGFSVTQRMSWIDKRDTTRKEDKAYALWGIFDVYMPLIYGEGRNNAFRRLREEIDKSLKPHSFSALLEKPETLKAVPTLLDNADEEETEGPPRNTEEVVKAPFLPSAVIKARKWFEDHQESDMKINLFEEDEGDPALDKIATAKEWFKDLERYVRPHMQVKIPPRGYHAPKIAILDTGLDEDHPAIMACFENFLKLKSFTDGNTRDFHGHGTFIASLILKVAPQSHLYIAKVTERRQLPLNHDIAGAIYWAIEQEDDIITMSFGMPKPDPDIEEAIDEAYDKNIIIFAGASNEWGNQGVTHPARNPEVIPIFSTDGMGNGSDFNPIPIRDDSFAILGEGIESSWTTCNNRKTTVLAKFKSGTSYACPVAAGVASLMLDFVKLHGQSWYPELHSRSGIIKVFDMMGLERNGYNYLCPWRKLFQEDTSSDSILRKISEEFITHRLSIKLPTQDTSRKEAWEPLTYKTDDNQRESRINADALESLGFDLCGQMNQLIEVPIRLGNSEDWQKHNLRILPVEQFQDCDILLGPDVLKRLSCTTNPTVPGLTKSKLKQHNSLGKQEHNERGFKHKSRPNIEYDNKTSSYGMPPDDTIFIATRAGMNRTGTTKEQAAFTAGWLRDWFPPVTDPTDEAFRTADKICAHRGGTTEDQIYFAQKLIDYWFSPMNLISPPKRPKN